MLLLEAAGVAQGAGEQPLDAYFVVAGAVGAAALQLAERLRDAVPQLRLQSHCGGGSLKSQMKRADRSGAAFALILGEDEVASGRVTLKYLRRDLPQESLALDALVALLRRECPRVAV